MKDKDTENDIKKSLKEKDEKTHTVKIQNTVSEKYVREKYVDGTSMKNKKQEIFGDKRTVTSAYGDEVIHKSHTKAKNKYKSNASSHQAELDHTVAAKDAYDFAKILPGVTDGDVKHAVNRKDNFQMIDKKLNASMGEQNKTIYALKSGKSIKDKTKMITTDIKAQVKVKGELVGKSVAKTSQIPASVNLAKLMQGESTVSEAVIGTVKDTVKAEVSGIAINSGVQLTQSALDKAQKQIAKKVGEKAIAKVCTESVAKGLTVVSQNVNAIVTVALYAGDAVIKFVKGDITCEEMFIQLGETGTNLVCSTAGAAVGGTIGSTIGGIIGSIILPGAGTAVGILVGDFIGNVIGGAIGYIVGSKICQNLREIMNAPEEVKEYEKYAQMYREYAEQVKQSRIELENYLAYIHKEQQTNILEGFRRMSKAIEDNSAQGIADSIDYICRQFDIEPEFKTLEEFESKVSDSNYVFKIGENT